jgi:hypothetical protein
MPTGILQIYRKLRTNQNLLSDNFLVHVGAMLIGVNEDKYKIMNPKGRVALIYKRNVNWA